MSTEMLKARRGVVTPAVAAVARAEGLAADTICRGVAEGVICIPANINHKELQPQGFGRGLKTKVNANIGTSNS